MNRYIVQLTLHYYFERENSVRCIEFDFDHYLIAIQFTGCFRENVFTHPFNQPI